MRGRGLDRVRDQGRAPGDGVLLKSVRKLMGKAGGRLGLKVDPGRHVTAAAVVLAYLGLHPDRVLRGVPTLELIKVGRDYEVEL